jgi:hypothetical protein
MDLWLIISLPFIILISLFILIASLVYYFFGDVLHIYSNVDYYTGGVASIIVFKIINIALIDI